MTLRATHGAGRTIPQRQRDNSAWGLLEYCLQTSRVLQSHGFTLPALLHYFSSIFTCSDDSL